jgi:hypothetical protein
LLDEEKAMLFEEGRLGFERLPCKMVFLTLRAYPTSSMLNEAQLREALQSMGIVVAGLDLDDSNERKFFNSLKTGDGYSLDKIILLGIQLSKGTPQEKAQLIFNQMDPELTK